MKTTIATSVIALAAGLSSAGTFNESTLGDFSDNWLAPTFLDFELGSNTVINSVVNSNSTSQGDRDYYTFSLEAGEAIDSINLISANNPAGGFDNVAFIGFASDSIFDFDPDAQSGPGLVGFVLSTEFEIGTDILGDVSGGLSSLGPGDYSIWVQQTGSDATEITLDFNVVPAPTSAALLGLGGLVALRRRR